jgi:hypothetical protein
MGDTSCTPSKDLNKLSHKNAIKHENRGPLSDFLTTPSTPSKEFKNDCASMESKFILSISNLDNESM